MCNSLDKRKVKSNICVYFVITLTDFLYELYLIFSIFYNYYIIIQNIHKYKTSEKLFNSFIFMYIYIDLNK